MVARIYSPAKSAMQSGIANTGFWLLQYEHDHAGMVDESMMGHTSRTDINSRMTIRFSKKEEAIAFARKNGIRYQIEEPHKPKRCKIAYSDNFRIDRKLPWTH